jgi:hypothetical protein
VLHIICSFFITVKVLLHFWISSFKVCSNFQYSRCSRGDDILLYGVPNLVSTFTFYQLLNRNEWETISKVSGKTLQKLLCTNLPPGILGVKYRLKKNTRECNYGLLISCPMSADYWRRNTYDLANFGEGLLVTIPRTSTFTV